MRETCCLTVANFKYLKIFWEVVCKAFVGRQCFTDKLDWPIISILTMREKITYTVIHT